jgi:hypothetical protein
VRHDAATKRDVGLRKTKSRLGRESQSFFFFFISARYRTKKIQPTEKRKGGRWPPFPSRSPNRD